HKECPCPHCTQDRSIHCKKPFKCAQLAKDLLTCILPKWNPEMSAPPYTLHISPEQIPTNDTSDGDNTPAIFNPVFPSPKTLDKGFRVFVAQRPPCSSLVSQTPTPQRPTPELAKVIMADAHQINNDGDHVSAGMAWFSNEDPRNTSVKLSEDLAGPGAGEICALIATISTLQADIPLQIIT
ncbi:hypothetical protein EDB19DRAFT_1587964, partial [Suillus lakei]